MLKKSIWFFTTYWHYILFVWISIFVYDGIFNNGFVNFDDHLQLTENYRVQTISFQSIEILFTTATVNMYQPLTSFILAVLFYAAKFTAGYYHLFSLLVHIFNGVLVYHIVIKLFKSKIQSVWIALFFLIHPIMAEAVSWVSATSTVLYVFFFLFATLCYLNFYKSGKKVYYFIAFLLFLPGLFCKIQIIIFIPVLFLIDWFYTKKRFQLKRVFYTLPFILLAGIFIMVAISFRGTDHSSFTVDYPSWLIAPNQVIWYVYKYIAPFSLTILYDWPVSLGIRECFFSFLFLVLLFSVYALRRNRLFVFGILFFLLTIGLHTTLFIRFLSPYADRYGYLPYLGFLIALFAIISRLKSTYTVYAGIAYILLFSYLTTQQTKIWKNSDTLWTHNLKSQKTLIARVNRASYHVESKQYNKSMKDIEFILKESDDHSYKKEKSSAYYYLGIINYNKNKLDKAERSYLKSIEMNPKKYEAFYNLVNLYTTQQNYLKSINTYTKGIAIQKNFPSLYKNRANAYYQVGEYKKALEDVNKALEINQKLALANTKDVSLYDFKKELLKKLNEN